METKLTEQQSLEVISEMINRAQKNVQKGAGTLMIFWGYMVAITALLNIVVAYILWYSSLPVNYSFHAWWIMLPAWGLAFILRRKKDRSAIVKTHIDYVISSVWQAFGISCVIFLCIIFSVSYSLQVYHLFYLINPVIILLIGVGEFITARTCRFRPFLHGAIAMWIGSVACALAIILFKDGNRVIVQFIILAVCMIIGFVVPGYKLNKLAGNNHV
jgi:hypothetical protein